MKSMYIKYTGAVCTFIMVNLFFGLNVHADNNNYRLIEELPAIENATQSEIYLNPEYLKSAKHENELDEGDILGCINRWHMDVYPSNDHVSTPYMLASLMDPVVAEVATELEELIEATQSTDEKIIKLREWFIANMSHTQMQQQFREFPGNDPWGTTYLWGGPTFKKLIPSEMKAMQLHTGKYSGKCMTLANFIASVYIHLGVEPDDIVLLLVALPHARHGVGFIKYEGEILFVNNYDFMPAKIAVPRNPGAVPVIGMYNHKILKEVNFWAPPDFLDNEFVNSKKLLMQTFIERFDLKQSFAERRKNINFSINDPATLKTEIFKNRRRSIYGDLAKYAYQSLYVKYPEYYLTASFITSHVKSLAVELESAQDIFEWIKSHIRLGSIFPDSEERIMTADQVLVFQRGSLKDQAVLAYSLLKHKGYDPIIKLASNNAYIEFDSKIFDVKDWTQIKAIPHKVMFSLKMRENFPGMMQARKRAHDASMNGHIETTLEIYESMNKKYPKSFVLNEELAMTYYEIGDFTMAQLYLEKANKLTTPSDRRYKFLSMAALMNHKPFEAMDYINKAIRLCPDKRELKADLIHRYIYAGHMKKAKEIYLENYEEMLNYQTFRQILKENFKTFRDRGLDHPDIDEFIAFMDELNPPRQITFKVIPEILPENACVYITGNQQKLGYWKPDLVPLDQNANSSWEKTIAFDQDTNLEFKFTLGSWESQAVHNVGIPVQNLVLHVQNDTTFVIRVSDWKNLRSDI